MNLAVDIGNTLVKIGLFQDETLIMRKDVKAEEFNAVLQSITEESLISQCLVSATGTKENVVTSLKKQGLCVKILSHTTPVPFNNLYKTPETLGLDRIALVAAASRAFPHENVLVIDAGTCITYDFKNSNNEYLGGAISPGLQMRYKALNTFTNGLPLLRPIPIEVPLGQNTAESIHSGIIKGIAAEIEGLINWYIDKYNDVQIVLTGGDMLFLSKTLKNGIFANSNFLLEGLNAIILFNKNQ